MVKVNVSTMLGHNYFLNKRPKPGKRVKNTHLLNNAKSGDHILRLRAREAERVNAILLSLSVAAHFEDKEMRCLNAIFKGVQLRINRTIRQV